MSHELEILENGQAAMAYVGAEKPWHGLGVQLQPGATPVEIMKAANLDWTVEKRENFHRNMQGDMVPSGNQMLIRSTDNKILSSVSEGWNPVQNHEAFDFFNEFCDAGQMQMDTAGSLFDGKKIWALAKVGSDFELFGGDKVEGYLLFSNPHIYGQSIDIRFTSVRVVCNNTLTLSLEGQSSNFVRMTHAREFDPEYAKEALGISNRLMEEQRAVAQVLGKTQMSSEKFEEFLGKVFGVKDNGKLRKNGEKALEILETQPGAEFARGSWWQGLNAVTYVTDHLAGRDQNVRLNNVWFGAGRNQKVKAVKLAVEMATA